jgi:hypothetical protein
MTNANESQREPTRAKKSGGVLVECIGRLWFDCIRLYRPVDYCFSTRLQYLPGQIIFRGVFRHGIYRGFEQTILRQQVQAYRRGGQLAQDGKVLAGHGARRALSGKHQITATGAVVAAITLLHCSKEIGVGTFQSKFSEESNKEH